MFWLGSLISHVLQWTQFWALICSLIPSPDSTGTYSYTPGVGWWGEKKGNKRKTFSWFRSDVEEYLMGRGPHVWEGFWDRFLFRADMLGVIAAGVKMKVAEVAVGDLHTLSSAGGSRFITVGSLIKAKSGKLLVIGTLTGSTGHTCPLNCSLY